MIDATDPSELAIHFWNETMGVVSAHCGEDVRSTELRIFTRSDVKQACGSDVYGCYLGRVDGSPQVVLSDREGGTSMQIAVHEMVHAIGDCELGQPDGNHRSPVWLRVRAVREGSVHDSLGSVALLQGRAE